MSRLREMATPAGALVSMLIVVAGIALAGGGDSYAVRLATLAGIQALLALGYQKVFGHAGALSLAQGALFGLGAYLAALVALSAGGGFWATLSLPAAMIAPALLAAIVGAVVLRLETHYFALATLALAQLIHLGAVNWESVSGGANGLSGIPALALPGVEIAPGWPMLLLTWGLVVLIAFDTAWRRAGLRGAAQDLARDHPLAAASVGIDVARLRYVEFVAGAALAGLAGGLQAHVVGVVSPDGADIAVMIGCLTAVVVGGRTRASGAILGAILLVHLPEWFRWLENRQLIAYGVATLLMVVLAPEGLVSLIDRASNAVWPRRRVLAIPPPAADESLRPATNGPTLQASHLAKSYGGVRAVDDVSLRLVTREALAVIGPNGSGKTTLLNLLSGVAQPDAGTIALGDLPVDRAPADAVARAGLARSFQAADLPATLATLDAVAVGAHGRPDAIARGLAWRALRRLGLEADAATPVGALPAGRRRLVEIARALATQPWLLALDEPAAGLSPAERAALADALRGLLADGLGIIIVEHDLDFLARFCARGICLDRGRVIAEAPFAELRRDPAVLAAYVGDAP
ncbi:MAG: ATP-binding cassette domain-containing protein [Alphaproteobacteria bacterium]|nr:ATP-binding cassette domain-containing protein [Alphaproteobacteria bacterium]MCW5741965.1 ATP-binding cassette domain-containing protein [Alphaproteobacteria bacterium]